MTRKPIPSPSVLQAEIVNLREELQVRDLLAQQLSQELFRLVKNNATVEPTPEVSEQHQSEVRSLREQIKSVEEQVTFYQGQLAERDTEIQQLRQSVKDLTERSRMLEQVVQELPRVYREKFAERMVPIKEKIARIQRENRQLHAELQSVSYRLAVRSRQSTSQLDLPSFPRLGAVPVRVPSLAGDL